MQYSAKPDVGDGLVGSFATILTFTFVVVTIASLSLKTASSLMNTASTMGGVVSDGGGRTRKRRSAVLSAMASPSAVGRTLSGSTCTRIVPRPVALGTAKTAL